MCTDESPDWGHCAACGWFANSAQQALLGGCHILDRVYVVDSVQNASSGQLFQLCGLLSLWQSIVLPTLLQSTNCQCPHVMLRSPSFALFLTLRVSYSGPVQSQYDAMYGILIAAGIFRHGMAWPMAGRPLTFSA
jgi:hypothetical protein